MRRTADAAGDGTRLKYVLEQAGVVFAADETGVSLLPPPEIVPLEKLNSSNDE